MPLPAEILVLIDGLPAAPGSGADSLLVNHAAHHVGIHAALGAIADLVPTIEGEINNLESKRYVALLTWGMGGAFSVASELKNTTGATVTASHTATGTFKLTFSANVLAQLKTQYTKVLAVSTMPAPAPYIDYLIGASWGGTNEIQFSVWVNGALSDDLSASLVPFSLEVFS